MAYSEKDKTREFDSVCSHLLTGMSLRKALTKVKLSDSTFFELLRVDEKKSQQYARATEQRAILLFEEMFDIADESPERMDTKAGTCIDTGDIQDKRVRIDIRKWALARMQPKKYSDHGIALEAEKDNTTKDSELIRNAINLRDSILDIYYRHLKRPENTIVLEGGSRSGKTNNTMRYIILGCMNNGEVWNIVAPSYKMLNMGSFIDAKDFIEENDIDCKLPANATQIRFPSGGTITFEVVTSENEAKRNRDNVYMNEADGLLESIASLIIGRAKGRTIIDYNPTKKFWSEKYKTASNTLVTTFRDNPFLSSSQIEWFDRLKRDGENAAIGSPERYVYEVYYLGLYSSMARSVFRGSDFEYYDECPAIFENVFSYSDPSLGVGADYFAAGLFGIDSTGEVYLIDSVFSQYETAETYTKKLDQWDSLFTIEHFIETNGLGKLIYNKIKKNYTGSIHAVSNMDNKQGDIILYSPEAKRMKYNRTDTTKEIIMQCVAFPDAEHDDAPDMICRAQKIKEKYFGNQ